MTIGRCESLARNARMIGTSLIASGRVPTTIGTTRRGLADGRCPVVERLGVVVGVIGGHSHVGVGIAAYKCYRQYVAALDRSFRHGPLPQFTFRSTVVRSLASMKRVAWDVTVRPRRTR